VRAVAIFFLNNSFASLRKNEEHDQNFYFVLKVLASVVALNVMSILFCVGD